MTFPILTTTPENYTVAVDIDGVVYELVPVLRERIHRVTGRPLSSMPDPHLYDIEKVWDLPRGFLLEQLKAGVQEGDVFWTGDAHQPGLAGLQALKDAGFRVVLVSARDLPGLEDLCFEATSQWLGSVDAVYDELVLTSDKNVVDYHFLVDDYEKNVRAALAAGRGAVLLDRCWNTSVELEQANWGAVPGLVAAHRDALLPAA